MPTMKRVYKDKQAAEDMCKQFLNDFHKSLEKYDIEIINEYDVENGDFIQACMKVKYSHKDGVKYFLHPVE